IPAHRLDYRGIADILERSAALRNVADQRTLHFKPELNQLRSQPLARRSRALEDLVRSECSHAWCRYLWKRTPAKGLTAKPNVGGPMWASEAGKRCQGTAQAVRVGRERACRLVRS